MINHYSKLLLAACASLLVGCGLSTESKLICNGREQVVGPKLVDTFEVKHVIATLHKNLFGSSKSLEVRTEKGHWIDAVFCYPTNQGDFFRGPGCSDYDAMIELDKQNGRLFIRKAPYRDENNVVAQDRHIVAEYFCKNAEPIK